MKRNISFLTIAIAIFLFFAGCHKQVETPEAPDAAVTASDEVIGTALLNNSQYCRLESVWRDPFGPQQRFILVLYDEYDNPTAITTPIVGTGNPFRTFKYDNWHRLKEFRGEYAGNGYEFWHFYGYDLNGRIGTDTFYLFVGFNTDGTLSYLERLISVLTYDAQGRIIREVTTAQNFGTNSDVTFNYDAAGNLIRSTSAGPVVYDNKVNFNRTNDIWQFLSRDYSMNNPYTATEYNVVGLPTIVPPTPGVFWSSTFQGSNTQYRFSYSCR